MFTTLWLSLFKSGTEYFQLLGWGGEDDDFSNRLHSNGYSIVRYSPDISRYTMLPHLKELPTVRNKVVESTEETAEQQVALIQKHLWTESHILR